MTLQELAQIGGAVGGIGVITSFVYFAVQLRNNTKAVRAATFQQLVASLVVQLDDMTRSRDVCDLVLRGGDDFNSLDRIDKARFRFHLMSFMRRLENAYMQHRIGTLIDESWSGLRSTVESILSSPGQRDAWTLIRSRMNPEFRAYIDGYVARAAEAAKASPDSPHQAGAEPKPQLRSRRQSPRRAP